MLTVKLGAGEASVEGARTKLGLAQEDLDAGFGVVPIDPDQDLYAVLVDDAAVERANPAGLAGGRPKIEAMHELQRANPIRRARLKGSDRRVASNSST